VPARRRLVAALSGAAPVIFAVPVLWGIAVSIVRLLGTAHPDLSWATTVNSDAEALYLGMPLHRDPATGYTGQMYTPLFPALVAVLHHLTLWSGWPVVVTVVASLALVAMTARVAFADPGGALAERVLTAAGALGVGAIGWWLVSALDLPLLYAGRADQFAWALALAGLVATACIPPGRRATSLLPAVALLSLAFWAKQNTIAASAAAVLWLGARSLLGDPPLRRALLFAAALAVVNLAVLGVVNLISGGWEWRLNFAMPREHATTPAWMPWVREGLGGLAPAIAFCAAMGLAAALAALPSTRGIRARLAGGGRRRRVAEILLAFAVVGFVAAVYFRRKQGSVDNQFIGVAWALAMLGGSWWATAQRARAGALAAAAVVLAGFALTQVPSFERTANARKVSLPPVAPLATWPEVPVELRDYAASHLLYHPLYSDLNVARQRVLYPNYYNFADLLAAGRQPTYVLHALLDRRFEAVAPFDPANDSYTSGFGKWEQNYLWKLNRVIGARYATAPGVPPGTLARRPGPERDRWMRACFGPFRAGDATWRIAGGGGFWCQQRAGGAIALHETPAAATEVRATAPARRVAGRLRLRLPRGWAELRATTGDAHAWSLRAEAQPQGGVALTVVEDGRATGQAVAPAAADGTVEVTLVPRGEVQRTASGGAQLTVPAAGGDIALTTASDSGLVADLGGLRLH
jgi:hypothetical protein